MSFEFVLFDLDGTLTDPFEGISKGILYALEKLGEKAVGESVLKSFVGPPLFDTFSGYFGFDAEKTDKAVRLYREYYSERGLFENKPTRGAREVLGELKRRGKTVCLATSKPREFSVRILEKFGFSGYFDHIGAATLDGRITTKTEVLSDLLKKTGAKPEQCLLVGDRRYDIEGAHAVNMKCAAVLCGFGSREEFAEFGADFVAEGLIDVLKIVDV